MPIAIALDPLSEGALFVLEEAGRLLTFTADDVRPTSLTSRSSFLSPFAMTSSASGTETSVYVNYYKRMSHGRDYNVVIKYSARGVKEQEWILPPSGKYTGIAVDPDRQILFLGESQASEIIQLDLTNRRSVTQSVAQLPGAIFIGSIAVSPEREEIFAVDLARGTLYRVSSYMDDPRVTVAGVSLGEPSAVAFDEDRNRVLVADGAGAQVWSIDLATLRKDILIRYGDLRQPTNIAVGPAGHVFVVDKLLGRVFEYSSSGSPVRKVP